MPGTYSQIYLQIVFAVKGRENLISAEWEKFLYEYISGIVRNNGQKLIAINGMPDHIHILLGIKPGCRLSDLVREIKKSSHAFVNERRFASKKFYWQEGYGVFSYSQSSLDNVINYIMNQKEYHRRKTFIEEYHGLLKAFEIEYREEFLLD